MATGERSNDGRAATPDPGGAGRVGERVTIWERLERPPRAPRQVLSHDRIADAAIEIADAEGLDAVSMRRLAERFGVAPMALRYVSSKNELVELMRDAAHAQITLPEPGAGWRTLARAYATRIRDVTLRHPWLVQAAAQTPDAITPAMLALTERFLEAADGLGLDIDTTMAIFSTVTAFVSGATNVEVAQRRFLKQKGMETDDVRLAHMAHIDWMIRTGRYPMVTRYVIEGSNDDPSWRFEFGLDCVLDGIAARLGI